MRCRLTLAVAIFTAMSNSTAAQVRRDVAEAAARIHQMERTLADAMHTRDRRQLEQLLAADYVLRGAPDIDRETRIQNAITLCCGDRSEIDGVTLTRLLSLKASHTIEYRNVLVVGFEGTDMRTAAALVFSWRDRSSPR
jgi:hypothetical protein